MGSTIVRKRFRGFSLTELLVALLIIGQIATFTIPKVLSSQQSGNYKAIAKEAAATVSEAYQLYRFKGGTGNFDMYNLKPYLNYVTIRTDGYLVDEYYGTGSTTCTSGRLCYVLHNGAILYGSSDMGGTASTSAMWFQVDPDGKYGNTTNGPGKSVMFWLYYNGRLRTHSSIEPNTCDTGWCTDAVSNADPPWFSWN